MLARPGHAFEWCVSKHSGRNSDGTSLGERADARAQNLGMDKEEHCKFHWIDKRTW